MASNKYWKPTSNGGLEPTLAYYTRQVEKMADALAEHGDAFNAEEILALDRGGRLLGAAIDEQLR
jgi:hypothetical protein